MRKYLQHLFACLTAAWLWNAEAVESSPNWNVIQNAGGAHGACVLESAVVNLDDGYVDTEVRLRFAGSSLRGITDSNIDLEGDGLGLRVDDETLVPIESLEGKMDVLLKGDANTLAEQFIRGREARLNLRFWPTWPVTGTKTATFSLIGFTKAWAKFQECR